MGPVNWLSATSSQYRFESLPKDGGILPVNWFEFSALEKKNETLVALL
jgi:hypothetical protein